MKKNHCTTARHNKIILFTHHMLGKTLGSKEVEYNVNIFFIEDFYL
jgi:hypothetical protein